jgi:hypothetical protein
MMGTLTEKLRPWKYNSDTGRNRGLELRFERVEYFGRVAWVVVKTKDKDFVVTTGSEPLPPNTVRGPIGVERSRREPSLL